MCCDRGVPGAWFWFAGVGLPVVGPSRLCGGFCTVHPVATPGVLGVKGVVWWPVWAWPAVFGRRSCPYVSVFLSGLFRDVRACGCCVVGITVVDTPSSAPPNGRLVLLLDALGRGSRVGSIPVVPVVQVRRPLMVGRVLRGRKVAKIGMTA